ncbi:MAG: Mannose-phosphate guanylyltransferase [Candidatus Saccharibacteria bacterium]|nr:Mannose-phosphate guanylyltransferase [Candidatus Saccharibacteria bacterium]
MSDDVQVPTYDTSSFSTDAYVKRIEKPWGYELHWVPADAPYMGKIMHINPGGRLSMQVHDQKQESYFMMTGRAKLIWENNKGELIETEMLPGQGYRTAVGQKHRIAAITDCDVIEASTPEMGTTWRLDDDYARPNETPEQRAIERSE